VALQIARHIDAIPELQLRAEPDTTLLCIGAKDPALLSIFAVARELRSNGWYVDEQTPPDSMHLTVNVVHENRVDEFIADLVAAVKKVLNALPNNGAGSAPLPYGSV
jgi:glutamate/tyrosine decarboxylase-like PLP-dependent enzyme